MLTDTLIATVLGLPLSVRLRLLNADPTGHGTECDQFGREQASARASEIPHDCLVSSVTRGGAWLPANPLVVLSVASDLYSQTPRGRDCWPHAARAIGRKWVLYLMATDANGESRAVVSAENVDPLAAAVEVLREVCRG